MGLFTELQRRNVFRVGLAYVVLGWVVIQVTDTVAPAFNMPDWTLTVVTWFGVIGFPFALIFAWAFELTPEGIKREEEVDRSQSITSATGRKIDRIVMGLLAVAVVFLVADKYVQPGPTEAELMAGNQAPIESEAAPGRKVAA